MEQWPWNRIIRRLNRKIATLALRATRAAYGDDSEQARKAERDVLLGIKQELDEVTEDAVSVLVARISFTPQGRFRIRLPVEAARAAGLQTVNFTLSYQFLSELDPQLAEILLMGARKKSPLGEDLKLWQAIVEGYSALYGGHGGHADGIPGPDLKPHQPDR